MTQAIQQTPPRKSSELSALVKSPAIASRFSEVLGRRAPQFISSLIQVGNSLGADCDSLTIVSGAMVAASLDLPINKNLGFAWLVPFKENGVKKAQFQMGYKGYIQLALRTGQYRRMNAGPMNMECVKGFDSVGERVLDFSALDPEKPVAGYFFAFEMVSGFVKVAYWSKKDVEAHARKYSQSYRGGFSSPWKTHFDEMATKTVIANELRQWGILSVEMQQALSTDQGVVRGLDVNEVSFPDSGPMVEVEATNVDSGPVAEGKPDPTPNDDGDLGPQTDQPAEKPVEKPAKARAPKATEQPKVVERPVAQTPATGPQRSALNQQLEASIAGAVDESGKPLNITFDELVRWAEGTGVVQGMSSFGGFEDVSEPICLRLVRANMNGSVVKGIIGARS
jgi:recombination protein RecT